jgi:glycosyltransferase involved in cell wall biosynthesis
VPQALLQAMAACLPIITCPVGGIPECTRGLQTVTLVPPRDAAALAAAMTALMGQPPQADALERARNRVIAEHSREVMYEKALRYFAGG